MASEAQGAGSGRVCYGSYCHAANKIVTVTHFWPVVLPNSSGTTDKNPEELGGLYIALRAAGLCLFLALPALDLMMSFLTNLT
jgi:hypothetical protein